MVEQCCAPVFPVLLCLKQNPFSGHFSGDDSYFYSYNPIRTDDMLSGKLYRDCEIYEL